MKTFRGHIYITEHAKERFIERRINVTNNRNKYTNVYRKMINMIQRSILVKYVKKENGKVHEYRKNCGCIFVCEREISKDFFKPDLLTVITVELTDGFIRRTERNGYEINDLHLNSYMLKKLEI